MVYSCGMKIGELAKKTKVRVDTVRYYEKRQLLSQPKRSSSGYRTYTEQDVKRLLFIVQAKTLGFTLEEIKLLLSLQLGQIDCAEVRKIAERKSTEIASRIENLSRIKQVLDELAEKCGQSEGQDECPILKSLADDHA